MPCKTYFNLSQEKQKAIFSTALEEFSRYNYKDASVTRIIDKLNIAKGSMYRYFKNKKDLYFYLIDEASKTKLEYINSNINIEDKGFFEVFKQVLMVGTRFDIEYPNYSIFISKVYNGDHDPFNNETVDNMKRMSEDFLMSIVKQSALKGEIRNDIESDIMAFFLGEIVNSIGKLVFKRYNLQKDDFVEELKKEHMTSEIERLYDSIIKLIKDGIGN